MQYKPTFEVSSPGSSLCVQSNQFQNYIKATAVSNNQLFGYNMKLLIGMNSCNSKARTGKMTTKVFLAANYLTPDYPRTKRSHTSALRCI